MARDKNALYCDETLHRDWVKCDECTCEKCLLLFVKPFMFFIKIGTLPLDFSIMSTTLVTKNLIFYLYSHLWIKYYA